MVESENGKFGIILAKLIEFLTVWALAESKGENMVERNLAKR